MMSADNWIYILHTKDQFKQTGENTYTNMFDNPIDAYRVAHTQCIDNFEYIEKNEIYNLWYYMDSVRWDSEVYYNIADAYKRAEELEDQAGRTEYWTSIVDATKYNFPSL